MLRMSLIKYTVWCWGSKNKAVPSLRFVMLLACLWEFSFFIIISEGEKDDPTPIQVEMHTYEEQVNKTLIAAASREGKTIDSDSV